jgi:putative Mn2+ efflux pump MntP
MNHIILQTLKYIGGGLVFLGGCYLLYQANLQQQQEAEKKEPAKNPQE